MTRFAGWLIAAALVLPTLATPAGADEVHARRSDRLKEVAHQVSLKMDRGHAILVAERSVFNGGPRHDEATFWIDIPSGAVATGLRTLGSWKGRPKWFDGDLMEAEAAAAKYRELTGIGGYYPKDPALLSWRSQQLLALQVFPCPPHEVKKVEYTLKVPTEYTHGNHRLLLNPLGTEALAAEVRIAPAHKTDRVRVDGISIKPGSLVHFNQGRALEVTLEPAQQGLIEGSLGVRKTSGGRHVRHVELFAAPKLSEPPAAVDVVVIIDASHSVDDELRQGMLQAARAYLWHLPEAQVQVMTFDRGVHTPLGGFIPSAQAGTDLEHLKVIPENGSDVETALLAADTLLSARAEGPARRIILFTDTLTHSRLTPERLRVALPSSGALLHIGQVTRTGTRLTRDDEHAWGPIARDSGGLMWQAQVERESAKLPELRRTYEEWVRPLRIDHLSLDTHSRVTLRPPTQLQEGFAFTDLDLDQIGITKVTLRGKLWTQEIQRTIALNQPSSRLWSALFFGSAKLYDITEEEMLPLAMYAGAVSPVTSYLAIEPGVRPSTEGLDHGFGWGAGRLGAPRVRMGATMVSGPPFDRHAWLTRILSEAWQRCGGMGTASVGFETTLDEVVLVDPPRALSSPDLIAERCLGRAVWDLRLPSAFDTLSDGWQLFVDA